MKHKNLKGPRYFLEFRNPCGCTLSLAYQGPNWCDSVGSVLYRDPTIRRWWTEITFKHIVIEVMAKNNSDSEALETLLRYFREVIHRCQIDLSAAQPIWPWNVGSTAPEVQAELRRLIRTRDLFHIDDLLVSYEWLTRREIIRDPGGIFSYDLVYQFETQDFFRALSLAEIHARREEIGPRAIDE